MHAIYLTGHYLQPLIFRSQMKYEEESMWIIQHYKFLVVRRIVWLIIKRGTNWSPGPRDVFSSG